VCGLKYLHPGIKQSTSALIFTANRNTMKQFFLFATIICFTFNAKADNDTELAKSYLFWVWNRSAPEHLISNVQTEKTLVEKKFKIAIDNVLKSGIDLGTAVVLSTHSMNVFSTNKRVLLVIYKAGTEWWDDVVLYIENNRIIDIGDVEKSFTMDTKIKGRNNTYKENLPNIFEKNAIISLTIMKEVKTLIRLANNHQADSFCKRVLYTGGDIANRKNRKEACNPAIPKDKIYCKAVMEDLSGFIASPDDFIVQYLKPVDQGAEIKIMCDQTKNVKEFVFSIVNGKLLLSRIY